MHLYSVSIAVCLAVLVPQARAQTAPAPQNMPTIAPARTQPAHATKPANVGLASWYGGSESLSKRTASGERFDPEAFTAAHRTLPFGTRLHVSANGRSVIVRVNDRGPFTGKRALDVSRAAAQALGIIGRGQAIVAWRIAD